MAAMMNNARAIIAFHNHPSGEPAPSRDDVFITKKIKLAGEIMGIELVDLIFPRFARHLVRPALLS